MGMLRRILVIIFGVFMVAAGANHFIKPEFYLKMMPPFIPAPELMVQLSGVAEILLGFGLFFERWRRLAAWGSIALLIAVFPANIYMYTHSELFPDVPPAALLIRLPLQLVLIGWAYLGTLPDRRR